MESPFIVVETHKDYTIAMQSLEVAANHNGFNVVHIHDMQKTFAKNNLSFNHYAIVELCNPQKAYKALSMDPRMGNMMPKEVIVYEDNAKKVHLMFMKPDVQMMDKLFPGLNIAELSQGVINAMHKIIEEAA